MKIFNSIGGWLVSLPTQSMSLMTTAYNKYAKIKGIDTWKDTPPEEHVAKAVLDLTAWSAGDKGTGRLIDASLRIVFAIYLVSNVRK